MHRATASNAVHRATAASDCNTLHTAAGEASPPSKRARAASPPPPDAAAAAAAAAPASTTAVVAAVTTAAAAPPAATTTTRASPATTTDADADTDAVTVTDARLWPGASAAGWRVRGRGGGHYIYTAPDGRRFGGKRAALEAAGRTASISGAV
jgi:hypothetical protein